MPHTLPVYRDDDDDDNTTYWQLTNQHILMRSCIKNDQE